MLNMRPDSEYLCPFLSEQGCSIYKDRPSACRTYPLERAVEKTADGRLRSRWFLTKHSYCKGHFEEHACTVKQWERGQQLVDFNLFNGGGCPVCYESVAGGRAGRAAPAACLHGLLQH